MKTCNICGKRIKDVKVVVHGLVFDVDVCADCLKPYMTHEYAPRTKVKGGKIIYSKKKK